MSIEWDKCYYVDCLDENIGLPYLVRLVESGKMEKIDIGFTDPIWGVGVDKTLAKGRTFVGGREIKRKEGVLLYDDEFNEEFNLKWFRLLEKICNSIILIISEKNKFWWVRNTDPIGDIVIQWVNGHSSGSICYWHKKSTYLVYGKLPHKIESDLIPDQVLKWGFLSDWKGIHPSPKGYEIPLYLLEQIKPKTLIDPFIGSGSYAQACKILNIKWIGYEINKAYEIDVNYRLDNTIRRIEFEKIDNSKIMDMI